MLRLFRVSRSNAAFRGALALGLLIRLLTLRLPGTSDMDIWKSWAYAASTTPVPRLYGVGWQDGQPASGVITYGSMKGRIDYPPLMIYVLGAIGRLYRQATAGNFGRRALNGFVRAPIILGDLTTVALLFLALRRRVPPARLKLALMAFWLNPAILLATTLAYLDAVAFPASIAALICATGDYALVSGVLVAISLLLKPQAILFAPILLTVWLRRGGAAAALRGIGGAGAAIALCLVPFIAAGTISNLVGALRTLGRHDMISGNACNLWWLVGYAIQMADAAKAGAPLAAAVTVPVSIVSVTRFLALGFPNPRYIGVGLLAVAAIVSIRTAWRRPELEQAAVSVALLVCSYFVLAAQVHENHFWPVVPLLIVAATLNPGYRRPAVVLSLLFAFNLAIFYGFGRTIPIVVPRQLGIDLTVVLSLAIVLSWSWLLALTWRTSTVRSPDRPGPLADLSLPETPSAALRGSFRAGSSCSG